MFPNQHNSITGSPPKIMPGKPLQMGYRTAEAARTCTGDCTSSKEVIDLVNREILYKQLNLRITTQVRAQKPTSLHELLSIVDEYVTDSGKGRESAWSSSSVNPNPPIRSRIGHSTVTSFSNKTSSLESIPDPAREPTSDLAPNQPTQAIFSLPAARLSQTTH